MISHSTPRSLSKRESQIVAWLEEERPAIITAADLARVFGLSPDQAADVARRMAAKGWLNRVAQGSYEPLLADSGGIALPNPWAALASWRTPYYVGYASAAHALNLTPDRPATVQVCVRKGTRAPTRFSALPLTLLPQRAFSLDGTADREVHGQVVCFASVERVLLDSAIRPARVGGAIALGRIVHRAAEVSWTSLVALAEDRPRGSAAVRRIAALLTVLGHPVPEPLADFAKRTLPKHPMLLDDRSIYGRHGALLMDLAVVVNVPEDALLEEVRR